MAVKTYFEQTDKKDSSIYFADKKNDAYYRIDGVKNIDIKNGRVFYKGATVYNDEFIGEHASDTGSFYIATWKDKENITKEEFDARYDRVKRASEPKYFFNIYNGNWFHIKDSKTYGRETIHNGTIFDTSAMHIIGNAELDEETLNDSGWRIYSKDDYERAFSKIIDKIK